MLLEEAGVLPAEIASRMRAMVGFRNVAVRSYQKLDLEILSAIIRERLGHFGAYTSHLLRAS